MMQYPDNMPNLNDDDFKLSQASLSTLIRSVNLNPDQFDIVMRACSERFTAKTSVQAVLKMLASALDNYIYWDRILRDEIWVMRRRAGNELTDLQKANAREVEGNILTSWPKVLKHIETLDVLTA